MPIAMIARVRQDLRIDPNMRSEEVVASWNLKRVKGVVICGAIGGDPDLFLRGDSARSRG